MATSQISEVIQHLRRTLILRDGAGLTDGQLLEDFINGHDEAALAALVRRHGPMVWGVCRRVLHHHHDAEDAFQATFLVFVRKARSIASRELLANWLYGVAHQTALKARATAARRRARERQVIDMPEPKVIERERPHDLQPLLDQELSRLPNKYRAVILLCDLEGKTRKEAARQLDVPEGTVAGRLARARGMLAKRLARHRLALSGGSLAAVLSEGKASVSVPTSVVVSTIKAVTLVAAGKAAATGAISANVAALTEGVLKTMLLTKFRAAIVIAFVIASSFAGGVLVWQSQAAEPASERSRKGESAKSEKDDLKQTLMELDNLWWKGDVETLRRLAADDLITVSGVGRYDKASLLEATKHRRAVDAIKRDIEVCQVSKDVAVLTYVYDCKVVVVGDGSLFQKCRDRRFSMTWAKRKDGWVVVFAQETILPGGE